MIIIVVARHCNIVSSLPMSCLLSCQVGVSQGPKPGRGIEGLKCLVNVLLSSYASVVRNCSCDCVERSDCYSNCESVP